MIKAKGVQEGHEKQAIFSQKNYAIEIIKKETGQNYYHKYFLKCMIYVIATYATAEKT